MSTAFRTALANLAALRVTGVANHYSIDNVPVILGRAQLPALLIQVIDTDESRLFRDSGAGFQTVAFANGARSLTVTVQHRLLMTPSESSAGLDSHLPALVDAIDAYFTALAADIRLGGALLEPPKITVEPGIFTLGQVDYISCAFRHTWLLAV